MQYKTCSKGSRCCHKDGPNLPLSEFYTNRKARDGHQPSCKECNKRTTERSRKDPRGGTTRKYERDLIARLDSNGIFADSGRNHTDVKGVDLLAWGFIRIETKYARLIKGHFHFTLGYKKRSLLDNDFIILVCQQESGGTYHVFEANHPVFYNDNGIQKRGFTYFPGGRVKGKNSLTDELMRAQQDRWNIINEKRDNWRRRLAA